MDNIAAHPKPVWPCDSLIMADLTPYGMAGRWEQFWGRRLTDTVFEMSCIPFFTYGISLGDIVEISSDCIVQRVIERNGHTTLRVAVTEKSKEQSLHEALHRWVEGTGLLYEFCSPGYVAVDLVPGFVDTPQLVAIEEFVGSGAVVVERDG